MFVYEMDDCTQILFLLVTFETSSFESVVSRNPFYSQGAKAKSLTSREHPTEIRYILLTAYVFFDFKFLGLVLVEGNLSTPLHHVHFTCVKQIVWRICVGPEVNVLLDGNSFWVLGCRWIGRMVPSLVSRFWSRCTPLE